MTNIYDIATNLKETHKHTQLSSQSFEHPYDVRQQTTDTHDDSGSQCLEYPHDVRQQTDNTHDDDLTIIA